MEIIKGRESMLSKERVLKAYSHIEPDRVPINYKYNPGIDKKVKKYLGLSDDDDEGLRLVLGVDFRGVGPRYTGPRLHQEIPERRVEPDWGVRTKWTEHKDGSYWETCDFPLKGADEEQIAAWPLPSPDDYDYESLVPLCRQYEDYAIYTGNSGIACVMNSIGAYRSMEQIYVDIATDDPAGILLIDRVFEIRLKILEITLEKIWKMLDFLWIGEDLGTQRGPVISMNLYQKHIKPRHKKFIDLGKAYGLKVLIHSCGSSSWAFDEFIDLGIDVVETLQPEAKDMEPSYLKKRYGDRLAFQGSISTAGPLAYGTAADVEQNVKETLEIMKPGGGYCLSPSHMIQNNTPVENVITMYRAAHKYGYY